MKNVKKSLILLGMMVVIMILITGCGTQTTSENTTGNTTENKTENTTGQLSEADKDYLINVGYYNCDHMTAACIAKDTGIYDALGLKVNVTGNGKVPEAMAAGKMDVGYIGTEGLMQAFLKGAPIIVAANNHLGGSYYLVGSNGIKAPGDLVGKKVALGTDPEKTNSSWITIAKTAGIPAEGKNYETFDMGDKDKFFALKANKLDGYICCDPWASMAEYEKAGYIVQTMSKLPTGDWGSCCVFSMNQNFAKDHPELAQKMILAHSQALEYIYTHPYKSAEIFSKNYSVPLEVALMTIYKKTVGEGRTLNWEINKKNFQDEINYELNVGTLAKAPGIDEFIKTDLLAQAGTDSFSTFIKDKVDPVFPLGMSYDAWKKKAAEIDVK